MRLALIIGIWLLGLPLFAQEVTHNQVEQALEDLAEADELETEDDSYQQQLSQLRRSPLNLNTATLPELQVFRVLNELLLIQLINYRNLMGPFLSVYELQAVPGWEVETIRRILPYVKVGPAGGAAEGFGNRFSGGTHSLLLRVSGVVEKSRGYLPDSAGNSRYTGSPQRVLLRYKYVYKNNLQFGILGEKDPGEQFFKGAQKSGFDFYSVHFFARNLGIIRRLALGDFTVNMGQGLLAYQSLAFRKSVDVLNIKRQTEVFRPYNSAGEYYYQRGAAITLGRKHWFFSAFASARKISASENAAATGDGPFISSVITGGLNRTAGEAATRRNTGETGFGSSVQYRKSRWQLGLNAVHYQLEKPLFRQQEPYNNYRFEGRKLTGISGEYGYTGKNFHLFGEMAFNPGGGKAMVHGLIAAIDRRVDFSVLFRKIDRNYQSLYGNAFTENSSPVNETGLFTGLSIRPVRHTRIDVYADVFRFPWLKYRTDRPSQGSDYLFQLTWQPNKQVEFYTRYRFEIKAQNYSMQVGPARETADIPRRNWRTQLAYRVSQAVTLRLRAEACWYDTRGKEAEQGFLGYADFLYKPMMKPLGFNVRLQYFETDGYNSRLYAFENDVLYSFSIPPFAGKGTRWYTNISYDITRQVSCWFRIARTLYPGETSVGSGWDEIEANHKTDYRVQLRVVF